MKTFLLSSLFVLLSQLIVANNIHSTFYIDTISKNGILFLPSKAACINGIAIGIVGSEVYCDYKITKVSNGLNVQIGQGLLLSPLLLYSSNYLYKKPKINIDSILFETDTAYKKAIHKGLLLTAFGTATDELYGVELSGFLSAHKIINGLSINLIQTITHKLNGVSISIINRAIQTKGLQIGLFNSTVNLKGIQIGLWNRNGRRSLPLVSF